MGPGCGRACAVDSHGKGEEMASGRVAYWYLVTIKMVNPNGGYERTATAEGVFYPPGEIGESTKLRWALDDASPKLGLGPSDERNVPAPDFMRYSVLFYICHKL